MELFFIIPSMPAFTEYPLLDFNKKQVYNFLYPFVIGVCGGDEFNTFNNGKKNKEIAQILGIDEKTISTYKLRLLSKLNVTNLVDLLKKAKDLEII